MEVGLRDGDRRQMVMRPVMQGKYGNLNAAVVSYGPCQTPTLTFCVERHQRIAAFQPETFWAVRPHVSKAGQRWLLTSAFHPAVPFYCAILNAGIQLVKDLDGHADNSLQSNRLRSIGDCCWPHVSKPGQGRLCGCFWNLA